MIPQKLEFCKCEELLSEASEAIYELARMNDLLKDFFNKLLESSELDGVSEKTVDRIDLMLELYFAWTECYRDGVEWNLRNLKKTLGIPADDREPVNNFKI